MYKAYDGFSRKPFLLIPNTECLFLSPSHRRALTYQAYGFMDPKTEKATPWDGNRLLNSFLRASFSTPGQIMASLKGTPSRRVSTRPTSLVRPR